MYVFYELIYGRDYGNSNCIRALLIIESINRDFIEALINHDSLPWIFVNSLILFVINNFIVQKKKN